MQNKTAPRWDLKNIYPDFKSKKYAESKKTYHFIQQDTALLPIT